MSEIYSVFIKKKSSVIEIKSLLEQILNSSLEKDTKVIWDLFKTKILGLEISLFEAIDYEDDRELMLSHFSYEITLEYIRNSFVTTHREEWIKIFSIILAEFICDFASSECLVVKNSHILVEKFLPEVVLADSDGHRLCAD